MNPNKNELERFLKRWGTIHEKLRGDQFSQASAFCDACAYTEGQLRRALQGRRIDLGEDDFDTLIGIAKKQSLIEPSAAQDLHRARVIRNGITHPYLRGDGKPKGWPTIPSSAQIIDCIQIMATISFEINGFTAKKEACIPPTEDLHGAASSFSERSYYPSDLALIRSASPSPAEGTRAGTLILSVALLEGILLSLGSWGEDFKKASIKEKLAKAVAARRIQLKWLADGLDAAFSARRQSAHEFEAQTRQDNEKHVAAICNTCEWIQTGITAPPPHHPFPLHRPPTISSPSVSNHFPIHNLDNNPSKISAPRPIFVVPEQSTQEDTYSPPHETPPTAVPRPTPAPKTIQQPPWNPTIPPPDSLIIEEQFQSKPRSQQHFGLMFISTALLCLAVGAIAFLPSSPIPSPTPPYIPPSPPPPPPSLEPQTSEPEITQEGISKITTSFANRQNLRHIPEKAIDRDPSTAWCTTRPNKAVGEELILTIRDGYVATGIELPGGWDFFSQVGEDYRLKTQGISGGGDLWESQAVAKEIEIIYGKQRATVFFQRGTDRGKRKTVNLDKAQGVIRIVIRQIDRTPTSSGAACLDEIKVFGHRKLQPKKSRPSKRCFPWGTALRIFSKRRENCTQTTCLQTHLQLFKKAG